MDCPLIFVYYFLLTLSHLIFSPFVYFNKPVMLLEPSKSNGNLKEGVSPKMSSDRKTEIGK